MKISPYWWEEAPRPVRQAPLPATCDVAIIGAGFTGLSAALTLARAGRQVLVLEAEAPGSGASSRNGGMIGSGHRVGFEKASKLYGAVMARDLLREGLNALAFTTGLIEREKIDCDYRQTGRFRGAWRPQDYEGMAREAEVMRREVGLETILVPKSEVAKEVAHERYHGGCIFPLHGGLHPGKFANGLLLLAEAAGAIVIGQTPVLAVDAKGKEKILRTASGQVIAKEVIVATNGYTRSGTPYFSSRLVPVPSYLIATEAIGRDEVKRLIPGGRMIVETRQRHCYYRASPDGERIILGARTSVAQITPEASAKIGKALLDDLFPSLRKAAVSHSWSGLTGMSRDHLPHLGKVGGLHFALGYSGSGVAMAPYLGWKIALQLLGKQEGNSPFALTAHPKVPLPFYDGRPWFLPIMERYYRGRDRKEGSL